MCVLEVLDRCTGCGFQLNDGLTVVGGFGVDDDVEVHAFVVHDAFEGFEVNPEVVGVEDFEFAD